MQMEFEPDQWQLIRDALVAFGNARLEQSAARGDREQAQTAADAFALATEIEDAADVENPDLE